MCENNRLAPKSRVAWWLTAGLVVALLPSTSQAIPAFARRHHLPCNTCHSAVPYLNSTGRDFKENGFRLGDEEGNINNDSQGLSKVNDTLYLEKVPPLSARAVLRPLVVANDGSDTNKNLDAVHELEFLVAGSVNPEFSFFGEIEAEDEDGFSAGAAGHFGYHPSPLVNVMVGWGSPFHADPYNSLKDGGHRLTVAHKAGLSQEDAAGAILRKDAQFAAVYGRFAERVFYLVGATGQTKDAEGDDPKAFNARVAVDVTDGLSLGGFAWTGLERASGAGTDDKFLKAGGDLNLDSGNLHAAGLFLLDSTTITPAGTGSSVDATDTAGYLEVFYTHNVDGRPLIMPLVRVDYSTKNDGDDSTMAGVFNLSSYVKDNVRLGGEADFDISVPDDQDKTWKVTLFGDLVF